MILEKLRTEGLTVPNHQSTVSLGLAESIREWFAGHGSAGGGGTAIETAPPIEATATKTRTARSRKKKTSEGEEPPADSTDATTATMTITAEAPSVAEA